MEDKTFKLPLQFGEEIALPDGRFVSTAIIENSIADTWVCELTKIKSFFSLF